MSHRPPLCGIGWRHGHERALLEQRPVLPFIEVHSENFFGAGGAARASLLQARQHWPVSLHGVGLALGSAAGLDPDHLDHLAALVAQVDPVRVSDHASFARVALQAGQPVVHAADLLPIALTEGSLRLMQRHVQQVQERLRRPLAVENLATCLQWADADYSEPGFFNTLTESTGCQLLLDVNNLVVNALNQGQADPVVAACAWVDAVRPGSVAEIHLAGYNDSGPLVIDDHGSAVHAPVWQVYRHALHRLGPLPTLVEWDTDLPALDVLLDQAVQAEHWLGLAAEQGAA